jgi:hypothetical protein
MTPRIIKNERTDAALMLANDLLKLSRALTIAEIERFYRNAQRIDFETRVKSNEPARKS